METRENEIQRYLQDTEFTIDDLQVIEEDFFSSDVYFLGETAVLKIFRSLEGCFYERKALEILKGHYPVPTILNSYPRALILKRISATPMKEEEVNSVSAYDLGRLLGKLHSLKKVANFPMKKNFMENTKVSLKLCENIVSSEILELSNDYLYTRFPSIDSLQGPTIIHRDFRPGNILKNKEGEYFVLDWELVATGFVQEDFAVVDFFIWQGNEEIKESFCRGYQTVTLLPTLDSQDFFLVCKAIGALGFYSAISQQKPYLSKVDKMLKLKTYSLSILENKLGY